jgi:hypothetical protein
MTSKKYPRKDYGIVRAAENVRHETAVREMRNQYAEALGEEDGRHLANVRKNRQEWRERHPGVRP